MKSQLVIKAAYFTILLPGTVTIVTPYFILRAAGENEWPALTLLTFFSIITGLSGVVILLYCIWGFAFCGKGTLAVIDPPQKLVVRGFYKHTRNPMYLAVLCILISEAIWFNSINVLIYTAVVFLAFHLFVIIYEEPHLRRVFGEEYKAYIKTIPRWGISLKRYRENNLKAD